MLIFFTFLIYIYIFIVICCHISLNLFCKDDVHIKKFCGYFKSFIVFTKQIEGEPTTVFSTVEPDCYVP